MIQVKKLNIVRLVDESQLPEMRKMGYEVIEKSTAKRNSAKENKLIDNKSDKE